MTVRSCAAMQTCLLVCMYKVFSSLAGGFTARTASSIWHSRVWKFFKYLGVYSVRSVKLKGSKWHLKVPDFSDERKSRNDQFAKHAEKGMSSETFTEGTDPATNEHFHDQCFVMPTAKEMRCVCEVRDRFKTK